MALTGPSEKTWSKEAQGYWGEEPTNRHSKKEDSLFGLVRERTPRTERISFPGKGKC